MMGNTADLFVATGVFIQNEEKQRNKKRKARMSDMILHKLKDRADGGYTTFGCVWNKGETKRSGFSLTNHIGEEVPVQSRIMAYWPDGSIKWSAHTADSEKMGDSIELLPALPSPKTETGREGIRIQEQEGCCKVDTGELSMVIPLSGTQPSSCIASDIRLHGKKKAESIYPVFLLEQRYEVTGDQEASSIQQRAVQEYCGEITSVEVEESGPLQAVFCFKGKHITGEESSMPFVIRMFLWNHSSEVRFVHTFLYDGVEEKDFLKGMGIRFDACLPGKNYQHHVQFPTDKGVFHETSVLLMGHHIGLEPGVFKGQLLGEKIDNGTYGDADKAADMLPVWDRYAMVQDSAYHYRICKQSQKECCELGCLQGRRAPGVMAVSEDNGGIILGIRDFWQKYPSGLEVTGISRNQCCCTAWFYSPEAESYDFRHYSTRSFPKSCYEGFEEVGASAYGIGVTSECRVLFSEHLPTEKELMIFAKRLQKPAVYVGTPEYYHEKRAFGYWGLFKDDTMQEQWLEEQLEKAFTFYQEEVEKRDWYGLFDYGDIMHTYDPIRHTWLYDMGGFAWQNTELVPTYWLWLYFLRTGREDVFTMAEAMTRHCSEVDIYHFGPLKGLGSRHNVRHWGCSCKEPRISMAGHQRFLYYLTGDFRLGDVMWEVVDADHAMVKNRHACENRPDGSSQACIRSGPDWSSLVSNWMTAYERTLDDTYRKKIERGIEDIAATPFGFASGPDFYYDTDTAHLIYRGEREDTPNQHLQICMGGLQIWLETADFLENDTLKKLLVGLGSFYFLDKEEKARITDGKIVNRPFSWPMLATGVAAYAAMQNEDAGLAEQTWKILVGELLEQNGKKGFVREGQFDDISWITTNRTSQWCLNVMMCMEFIRNYMKQIDL